MHKSRAVLRVALGIALGIVLSASAAAQDPPPMEGSVLETILALKPAETALADTLSEVFDDMLVETLPTPPTNARRSRPFDRAKVAAFATAYRKLLSAPPPAGSAASDMAQIALLQGPLDEALARARRDVPGAAALNCVVKIDRVNRDAFSARRAQGEPGCVMSFGVEALQALNDSVLNQSHWLLQNYLLLNSGFFSGGTNLFDTPPEVIVALAPQLSAPSQMGERMLGPGGVARSEYDRAMGSLDALAYARSPRIPAEVRLLIQQSAGAMGLVGQDEDIPFSTTLTAYLPGLLPLEALHHAMLQDALTYLAAHELAHVVSAHSGRGGLADELAADRIALTGLSSDPDVDVRAVVLAVTAFAAKTRDGVLDADHPAGPDRLRALFTTVGAISPNLVLDVEAAQVRLGVPVRGHLSDGLVAATFVQTLSHELRFKLDYEEMTEEAFKERGRIVRPHLEIELYDPARPDKVVARAKYASPMTVGRGRQLVIPQPDNTQKIRATGWITVSLPAGVWTRCPNCAVRLTQISFDDMPLGDDPDLDIKWETSRASVSDMLAAVRARPQISAAFEELFLARSLFRDWEFDKACEVYLAASPAAVALMSPDDFLRWANCGAPRDKLRPLDLANERFPREANINMLRGLILELLDRPDEAIDAYVIEANRPPHSQFQDAAAWRVQRVLRDSARRPTIGRWYAGHMQLVEAEAKASGGDFDVALFRRAYDNFGLAGGGFSALHYRAQAAQALAQLGQLDFAVPRSAWADIIARDPWYVKAYSEAAKVEMCAGDPDAAVAQLVAGFWRNGLSPTPGGEQLLKALDDPGLRYQWCWRR